MNLYRTRKDSHPGTAFEANGTRLGLDASSSGTVYQRRFGVSRVPLLDRLSGDLFTRTRERNLERYRRCLSGRTPRTPPPASCQGAVTHSKRVSEKTRAGGVARVADKCTSYEASPNNEDRSPFGPTLGDAFVAGVRR